MSSNASAMGGSSPDLRAFDYFHAGALIAIPVLLLFMTVLMDCCPRRNSINTSQLSQDSTATLSLQAITIGYSQSTASAPVGVDDATLKSYPVLLYLEAKHYQKGGVGGATSCSVCLEDYNDSEWLRELPDCGHLFHRNCIDMWMSKNSSCPLCRNSLLPMPPVPTPPVEVAPLAISGAPQVELI